MTPKVSTIMAEENIWDTTNESFSTITNEFVCRIAQVLLRLRLSTKADHSKLARPPFDR